MASPEYLDKNNDDGTIFGHDSSSKIAFYGGTPQVQATISAAAAATTVAISTGTIWGYASSTQANAIVSLVNELRAELVAIGLCA
jgi:UDP-N-acetyl-D-mannosaminuronic acid transferase (WecB/TagA/CpsF family)